MLLACFPAINGPIKSCPSTTTLAPTLVPTHGHDSTAPSPFHGITFPSLLGQFLHIKHRCYFSHVKQNKTPISWPHLPCLLLCSPFCQNLKTCAYFLSLELLLFFLNYHQSSSHLTTIVQYSLQTIVLSLSYQQPWIQLATAFLLPLSIWPLGHPLASFSFYFTHCSF